MGEYNLNVRISSELRDQVSARASGEVSLSEVVRRLLLAYVDGKVNVQPRSEEKPTPPGPLPEPVRVPPPIQPDP